MKQIIASDDDGFSIKSGDRIQSCIARILWPEIATVIGFKRDCYTVDLICLGVETVRGTTIEINEEIPGWPDLLEALSKHLPGFPKYEEWFETVAFPAFKANARTLFHRACDF
jgi:hypothetical protein